MSTRVQVQLFSIRIGDPVRWRLLSANNRECGRGVLQYADAESCRIAIKELQRDVHQYQRRVRRSEPNKWGWELLRADGGQPVVASAHPFDRVIRCERSLELFVRETATAGVAEAVVYTASRRWGSVAS